MKTLPRNKWEAGLSVNLLKEPLLPAPLKTSDAKQRFSPDASPSLLQSQRWDDRTSSYSLTRAAASSAGNSTKLRWEKRILWRQIHTLLLLDRKPGSYSCTAHRQSSGKDKAYLHVLCYMTLIVRYDSGRFIPDILQKSLQGSSSARCCPIKHAASCLNPGHNTRWAHIKKRRGQERWQSLLGRKPLFICVRKCYIHTYGTL